MTEQATAPEATTEAAAAPAPELQIRDLALAVNVIDLCAKRGAFEGPEMEQVGGLRGRLAAFVKASLPEQPAEQPAEDPAEGAAAEETVDG
jgi:hypothetical protein